MDVSDIVIRMWSSIWRFLSPSQHFYFCLFLFFILFFLFLLFLDALLVYLLKIWEWICLCLFVWIFSVFCILFWLGWKWKWNWSKKLETQLDTTQLLSCGLWIVEDEDCVWLIVADGEIVTFIYIHACKMCRILNRFIYTESETRIKHTTQISWLVLLFASSLVCDFVWMFGCLDVWRVESGVWGKRELTTQNPKPTTELQIKAIIIKCTHLSKKDIFYHHWISIR